MKNITPYVASIVIATVSAAQGAEGDKERSLSAEDVVGSAPYREAVQRYFSGAEPKIVGGQPSRPGQFPWQVSLQASWIANPYHAHFCGGTVYSDTWIVTAAHCVADTAPRDVAVVAGTNVLGPGVTRHNIARIIVHAGYNAATSDNDIALLELRKPIKLSENVKAIPLANPESESTLVKKDTPLVVTGWGATQQGGQTVRDLRFVQVPFVERNDCNQTTAYDGKITDNMICAGRRQGGTDSCQGDSGGPLTANTASNPILVGVVSWGEGCAQPNRVGVYARVANYASWVASNTAVPRDR